MAPLSLEVWIGIGISYLLVNIILFFINRLLSHNSHSDNDNDVVKRQKYPTCNVLCFCCAGFTYQNAPHSLAGRSKLIVKPIIL